MKKVSNLKIMRVPVSDLNLHPHNARQGDVGAICQSLEAHGQYKPLVVQKSSNTVLAGNHTLQAASALGWKEVDNRTSDQATYDDTVLTDLLEHLVHTGEGLHGTGWDGDDLDELLADVVPKFQPTDAEQPRLDQRNPTTCPNCEFTWRVDNKGEVVQVQ